jgi:hypothetical protein
MASVQTESANGATGAVTTPQAECLLAWRVHLLRREPHRLPGLLCVFFIAAVCVWLLFERPLPVLAALLLLIGATGEFLFPVTYRITEEGVYANTPTGRLALRWKETRRCLRHPFGVTLSPLPIPSRLDAFRGVTLRFALEGEPGDRESVLAAIARCMPDATEAKHE